MSDPTKSDVYEILLPHCARIEKCVREAWGNYRWLLSSEKPVKNKRTIANTIWDWSVQTALLEFSGDPRVKPIHRGTHTTWFLVDGKVVFRFKKGGDDGYSKNYPTQSALDFHEPDRQLDGLPEVIKVDVVYITDETNSEVKDIRVVCRNGSKISWSFSLLRESLAEMVEIPRQVQLPEGRTRVVLKKPLADSFETLDSRIEK
ncbi:hypothetical protein [Zhongshania aquimaris]|uniref:Uncharacterized protein n=1 Tax=Zhongshania aquimaris TaxID=2857107 RepID=A0ABS6VMY8_9GAMM|nr:hypothetical protein [Zhongshania aquimaris]MBW2939680.1 hypothetical protein [Zhongshania aquimaris]